MEPGIATTSNQKPPLMESYEGGSIAHLINEKKHKKKKNCSSALTGPRSRPRAATGEAGPALRTAAIGGASPAPCSDLPQPQAPPHPLQDPPTPLLSYPPAPTSPDPPALGPDPAFPVPLLSYPPASRGLGPRWRPPRPRRSRPTSWRRACCPLRWRRSTTRRGGQ